ncbi:MAG TPA: 50S ribosomal protein L18 [Candidatus Paceibacterota bacterium]|jgi:large subunit ribosomal protein L18|nr:50S ribosomal protein L18 [Candidatus Paceibacterota bacterium]HRS47675.1 50S ribosomal protein L18 [Candidatus Paceibacterota bacterium]
MAQDIKKLKREKRIKVHKRIRAKISGTSQIPRLAVFKSNKNLTVQLIDDESGKTILSLTTFNKDVKDKINGKKSDKAYELGVLIAEQAKEKGIEKIVFDRGGFIFHGRIEKLAQGLREGGLKF